MIYIALNFLITFLKSFNIITSVRIILMHISAAIGVLNTVANIAIPCSVNTYGFYLDILFAVPVWNRNSFLSSTVN